MELASDLDATATLAAAEASVVERRAAQVCDLQLVLHWADLHSGDPQAEPGAVPASRGGDRLVALGGDGTPQVAELTIPELAIARHTHPPPPAPPWRTPSTYATDSPTPGPRSSS